MTPRWWLILFVLLGSALALRAWADPPAASPAPAPAPAASPTPLAPAPGEGVPAILAAPAVAPPAAPPAARRPRPTEAVKPNTCTEAGCHADVKQYKAIHGPVNVNACDACHTLKDASKHEYVPTRPAAQMCVFCHEIDTSKAKVVHKPLQTGECIACHNPHGGFDKNILRSQSMQDLCKGCHGNLTAGKKSVHGPVAAGACGTCHRPHMSDNPKLLVAEGRTLCLTCHQEMAQQLKTVKFVHKAVEGDCAQCHDPHASDQSAMIRKPVSQLCTDSCHKGIKQAITEAPYKHTAVTQDKACTNCHTSHGSDSKELMRDRPVTLCLRCHDQDLTTPDGRAVPAVSDIANPALVKHGPAKDGSCSGCHNVHGSNVSRLLAKPYPATFYAPFKLADYDLCFTCHDKQLVLQPQAHGLTNFRDGDLNLHFMHVNKDPRGRTCRACHATHASPSESLIRDAVPFGNWMLPINYRATSTGGSCSPGCHQALAYDRVTPQLPAPGSSPASVAPGGAASAVPAMPPLGLPDGSSSPAASPSASSAPKE